MDLRTLEIVPDLLTTGVWWDLETSTLCEPRTKPHPTHGCVLVVPFGDEYRRVVAELELEHAIEIRAAKGKAADILDRIRGQALGKTVLKDWANFERDGKHFPFSEESAVELMTDPKWKQVRSRIESAASNESALRVQEEKLAAGN